MSLVLSNFGLRTRYGEIFVLTKKIEKSLNFAVWSFFDQFYGTKYYWHESWSPLGNRLATMLVATISAIILFLFFFLFLFRLLSHTRSARIKNLFSKSCSEHPKKLGIHPFEDSVGHLGAPWRPFWILQVGLRF